MGWKLKNRFECFVLNLRVYLFIILTNQTFYVTEPNIYKCAEKPSHRLVIQNRCPVRNNVAELTFTSEARRRVLLPDSSRTTERPSGSFLLKPFNDQLIHVCLVVELKNLQLLRFWHRAAGGSADKEPDSLGVSAERWCLPL